MADNRISSLSRNFASTTSAVRGSDGNSASAISASGARSASASGSGRASVTTSNRQVVNVEGENLDKNARRGTYLNIVV